MTSLSLSTIFRGFYNYPHVVIGETEAPDGEVPSSRSLSQQVAELRYDPRLACSVLS